MGVALGLSGMRGLLRAISVVLGAVGLFHLIFMVALYFHLGPAFGGCVIVATS